jgi:hypothetical protein
MLVNNENGGRVTPWEVLGIDPTRDRRAIKKAYALRLKTNNPEDDPMGFQELRNAYEMALALASFAERDAAKPIGPPVPPVPTDVLDERPSVNRRVEGLMEHVRRMYADGSTRGNEENWRAILSDESLWSLDVRAQFAARLFSFLLEGAQDLAGPVLVLLDQEFRFREDGFRLHRFFGPPEAVESVLRAIQSAFTEHPLRGFENREMFALTESRSQGWLDDHLPSFDRLTDWLGRVPTVLCYLAVVSVLALILRNRPALSPTNRNSNRPIATSNELYSAGERGVPTDPRKTLDLSRGAAAQGDTIAQRRLGQAYPEGWAGEPDAAEALEWFDRASRKGDAESMTWIGFLYEEGRGVPANPTLAAEWYQKAALLEVRWAQFRLGRLLAEGPEALRNPESAFFWLYLASGDEKLAADAAPLLAKVRSQLRPKQIRALEERMQRWVAHLAKNRRDR